MDNEIHYLTYDPEEIWLEAIKAYVDAGGDVLYPGDEKEMILRGVQAVIVQLFAGVDAALRMNTLRYALGEYLDIYGEGRKCIRIAAQAATGEVEIRFRASGIARTIEAGTTLTTDGDTLFLLADDIEQTGSEQTVTAAITCQETGGIGNSLLAGTQMQFMVPNPAVISIYATKDASGGQDEEDDETYRERIRLYGLTSVTTGPVTQYESVAMNVTSEIINARALNLGPGTVGVYLILANDEGAQAIIERVTEALSEQTERPLTDYVRVYQAKEKAYTLNVSCTQEMGGDITDALNAAIKEYQDWQDNVIGRAFNPDRLMAMLYQAGAIRVVWEEGSAFDGGDIQYTTIDPDTRCKGTISMAVVSA